MKCYKNEANALAFASFFDNWNSRTDIEYRPIRQINRLHRSLTQEGKDPVPVRVTLQSARKGEPPRRQQK